MDTVRAGKTAMAAQHATTRPPADLPEDIHAEILARLPAKSVLRFHSVCKAWRRITAEPRFLATHARLRPAQVVLYMYLGSRQPENWNRPAGYGTDISSVRQLGRRRIVRYPEYMTGPSEPWFASMPEHCPLLASCGGVLLFDKGAGSYLLCNPVTRQWATLSKLTDNYGVGEYAFYFHEPSGEHRLLCGRSEPAAGETAWYVLSTGAAAPRRVVDTHVADGLGVLRLRDTKGTPVALHGRLHWPPRGKTMKMLAFDVVAETFHAMAGPRVDAAAAVAMIMKLFDMDGQLVAADFGEEKHVDLWFLTDYGADDGRWERRHRVLMPWFGSLNLMSMAAASDDQGNVMLGNQHGFCMYNVRTKMMGKASSVAVPSNVLVSRHVFRESLVQYPGFWQARSSADMPLIHFWV